MSLTSRSTFFCLTLVLPLFRFFFLIVHILCPIFCWIVGLFLNDFKNFIQIKEISLLFSLHCNISLRFHCQLNFVSSLSALQKFKNFFNVVYIIRFFFYDF